MTAWIKEDKFIVKFAWYQGPEKSWFFLHKDIDEYVHTDAVF